MLTLPANPSADAALLHPRSSPPAASCATPNRATPSRATHGKTLLAALLLLAPLALTVNAPALAQEAPPDTAIETAPPVEQPAEQPSEPAGDASPRTGDETGAGQETGAAPDAETEMVILGDEIPAGEDSYLTDDMSPLGMFMHADIVVKLVMISLAFASVVTWTIAASKTVELGAEIRRARRGRRWLAEASSLEHALMRFENTRRSDAIGNLVHTAAEEIRRSPYEGRDNIDGIKERVRSHLDRIELAAGRQIARGTGLLATIASTAPFVGLFGTVWGIMNSFIGISRAQTTNLAVVAPGIAEALLATALGLVAAIPAVMLYNLFARRTAKYRAYLGDASAEIMRHVSRDAERRRTHAPMAAE